MMNETGFLFNAICLAESWCDEANVTNFLYHIYQVTETWYDECNITNCLLYIDQVRKEQRGSLLGTQFFGFKKNRKLGYRLL